MKLALTPMEDNGIAWEEDETDDEIDSYERLQELFRCTSGDRGFAIS